jgi:hypothetical protein
LFAEDSNMWPCRLFARSNWTVEMLEALLDDAVADRASAETTASMARMPMLRPPQGMPAFERMMRGVAR